jgi:hypothetical protein
MPKKLTEAKMRRLLLGETGQSKLAQGEVIIMHGRNVKGVQPAKRVAKPKTARELAIDKEILEIRKQFLNGTRC